MLEGKVMNYQDLRENKMFLTGGIVYLISYAIFTAVKYFTLGLKDVSGWYLIIVFSILLFAGFVYSVYCVYAAVKAVQDGDIEQKHNLPFWVSVWGDLGYACMLYTVIDLFI